MKKDTINNLINNFSIDLLQQFFRENIRTFRTDEENYEYLFEDNEVISGKYSDIYKRGEAELSNSDDLLVITVKTLAPLTDKTGKKQQFDIAKKVLNEEFKDAAFFIFYDEEGNFRFSLIRTESSGVKRKITHFKRYTYFVSKNLTNKTFINQISKADFNDLDSILEAFNVEPISKEFYAQLQHWYFWAIDNVEFPEAAEKEKNGREIAIIRLITRLMFIWFMKVRNLVPNDLFDEEKINSILKNYSPDNFDYYKAILQNLFFATLNTRQKDRKYRSEKRGHKGFNTDFGKHNVFRYQDCFRDDKLLITLFSKIPFLNGGLFDCLDYKAKEKEDRKYIDGFTATKSQQPKIPNSLFFSEPQKHDLSRFYDKSKKNKLYEVEGIINLLNRYNFTIDENEPDDIEVALDPELLGSIFENLLASYNPETATTARKATGSFYTPREIVNYMTTESLKQYFKTALKDDTQQTKSGNISKIEKNIDSLLQSNTSENSFDEITTKKIIKLINDLRVVDPAVGSGAFPMAMLNKLVFILEKLDPHNQGWKQSQIDSVKQSVTDPVIQRKLITQIERQFAEKNADYGRKLYLIEKCIYGVDIQQIAVEIAKLRFFISLLVDENIDFNKPETNYGIEPLPNLDFKLMQGNSLISEYMGLSFDNNEKEKIDLEIEKKKAQLKEGKRNQEEKQSEFFKILSTEKRQDEKLKTELEKLEKTIKKFEKELKELHDNKDRNDSEDYKRLIKEFEELKNEYLNVSDKEEKDDLLEKIEKTILKIFEEKISQHLPELKEIESKAILFQTESQRIKYISHEKAKLTKRLGFDIEEKEKELLAYTEGRKPKDFFLWNLYYAEVFTEKGGFDVVIGNPPYIQLQKATSDKPKEKFGDLYKNCGYKTFKRTGDIYALFYEKGIQLLTEKGLLCYITSNKWMRAGYGDVLRGFFAKNNPKILLDFGGFKVFEAATVDTNIILLESMESIDCVDGESTQALQSKMLAVHFKNDYKKGDSIEKYVEENKVTLENLSDDTWFIGSKAEIALKQKIEQVGIPLKDWDVKINFGIKTGYNEAFIIDEAKRAELIARDPKSEEIIKPILRGRDIQRYSYKFAGLYLIDSHNGYKDENGNRISPINIYDYPAIKSHLDQYWDKISVRQDKGVTPYNLRNCAYYPEFGKEKVGWSDIATTPTFTLIPPNIFFNNTVYTISGSNRKYFIALLNSKVTYFIFPTIATDLGEKGNRYFKIFVEKLPILPITPSNRHLADKIEELVDRIITAKKANLKANTTELEQEVDLLVYKLYGLTYEEVKIVEPTFALTEEEYNAMKF